MTKPKARSNAPATPATPWADSPTPNAEAAAAAPLPSPAFPDDGSGASPFPVHTAEGVAPTLDNDTPRDITLNNTSLYSAQGKVIGRGHSGTYAATIVTMHGHTFYKFRRKDRTVYARTDAKSLQPGAAHHPTGGSNVPVNSKAALFAAGFLAIARNAAHRCNISPWVILAQWAVETGWGTSALAAHHNLAGIRWYNRPGQTQRGGTPGKIGTGFSAYRTVSEFVDDYVYVMNLPYYRDVRILWHPVDDEAGVILPQCRALGASPYDAGHYKGGTHEVGHALISAWHLLRPIAADANRKGPNA